VAVDYGPTRAVHGVDLLVRPGETLALLGPSGSGKTTLLYALAGFLSLSEGRIELAGQLVASAEVSVPPERRPVAMVFQHYGLWPHLDALETVAYPMRRAGVPGAEARRRAAELLEQLRIGHLAARRPAALSGGEQQRVGLARALARRPSLYLLDEPTAHLDGALKRELQSELAARLHGDGAAAVHATHDVEEALAVADRVALLRDGRIIQVGSPAEVYAAPIDAWAAELTGPASFVSLDMVRRCLPVSPADDAAHDVAHLVRPDWVRFDGPLDAAVSEVRFRGTHTDYRLAYGDAPADASMVALVGDPAAAPPGGTTTGRAATTVLLREPGLPRFTAGDRVTWRIERAVPVGGTR
jgi:ABC-type Fe3+/spermidine/putrescine transport system ATPase subunit